MIGRRTGITRRQLGRMAGATGAAAVAAGLPRFAIAQAAAKVVIVGGGAGGATVAHLLKKDAPGLDVTLIESDPTYSSSFFSNLYIGGFRTLESLNHGYAGLRQQGVKVVHERAIDIDVAAHTVKTRQGNTFAYDRLVLSPGIAIKYDAVPGYSRAAAQAMPHAYTTDAGQKRLLRQQLEAMPDGGTVVMATPNNPYRCPPGPYERACMIAHFLKTKKPKSKLVILDPKKAFSKQAVFTEAIERYYKGIVTLHLTTEIDDFSVVSADPATKTLQVKQGQRFTGDVVNLIAPQRANDIAGRAGVTDGDWCPINPDNFASRKVKDVYVIGDATIADPMPKSAFSANSHAKVVAADIAADLAKKDRFPARYRNTCWSLVAPDDCIKIGANYAPKDGKLEASGGFVSQRGEDAALRKQNYVESVGWYDGITAEMFSKTAAAPAPAGAKKG